jgi:membrane protein implicated in regulation of membrane protease activity
VLATLPSWVDDLRVVGQTVGAMVLAFGGMWRYAIKPFLSKLERDRNEDFDRRLEERIHPVEDKVDQLKTATNTKFDGMTSRIDRLSDSVTGTRVQLGKVEGAIDQQTRSNTALIEQQRLLHADVRAHMETEEKK